MSKIVLYHGSDKILSKPLFGYGKIYNDYGQGFYCTQNSELAKLKPIHIDKAELCHRYMSNRISKAIVFGGLEPFDQFDDVLFVIRYLRCSFCQDDIVIYTGYNKEEIADKVEMLKQFSNIVIKFGRYIPDQTPHFDPVLGINLASDNQYAEKIS